MIEGLETVGKEARRTPRSQTSSEVAGFVGPVKSELHLLGSCRRIVRF